MKRLISVLCSFLFLGVLFINSASADQSDLKSSIPQQISKSEYTMYQELLARTDSELVKKGYTTSEIEAIRSFSYEEAFFERAQLPKEELLAMGYSPQQIRTLKAYDGSALEDNPQLMSLMATLNGALSVPIASTSLVQISFFWEWDVHPVFYGDAIDDQITFAWRGTDHQSNLMMLTYSPYYCYHNVRYYSKETGDLVSQKTCPLTVRDAQGEIYSRFEMGTAERTWAKEGYMYIGVAPTVSGIPLHSANFAVGYGHEITAATPSISVAYSGVSVSLDFAWHTTEAFYGNILVRYDGTVL